MPRIPYERTPQIREKCSRARLASFGSPLYRNKEWLTEQHHTQRKTLRTIAKETGFTGWTLGRWCKKLGVPVRPLVRRGEHPGWKGGQYIDRQGYVRLYSPEHPRAGQNGYVREHLVVAERKIGRPLQLSEVVHHINGIKADNSEDNLIVTTRKEHNRIQREESFRLGFMFGMCFGLAKGKGNAR